MNSREKGKRGERQWRDELRARGYRARRGAQYCGTPDSPDVICEDLGGFHFEVKLVERLNIYGAMAQAIADCGRNVPVLAHRRTRGPWLATLQAEQFFDLLAGTVPPAKTNQPEQAKQTETVEHEDPSE